MGSKEDNENPLEILVEVASACLDGPIENPKTYDVCCIGKLASKTIHQTKYIRKTVQPVWTIDTESIFLLKTTPAELKAANGLTFELLNDSGILSRPEEKTFGTVNVSYETVVSCQSERLEFLLEPSSLSKENKLRPLLSLRFRHATKEDINFMKKFSISKQKKALQNDDKIYDFDDRKVVAQTSLRVNLEKMISKRKIVCCQGEKLCKHRVEPYPDPLREDETKFMTKDDMLKECLLPSQEWIQMGEGDIGHLYLEIIKCDNLPNMDKVLNAIDKSNKTDAFVAVAFEGCFIRTDTINDSLSPKWMPWTQRAFTMPITHPTSLIFLGVFDHDAGDLYDPIGRIIIDISSLYNNTDYMLTYDLHADPNVRSEGAKGTITVRIRTKYSDEFNKLRIVDPPRYLVNVKDKKNFSMLRYVCKGESNTEKGSLANITERLYEILSYSDVFYLMIDTYIQLILWRGEIQFELSNQHWLFRSVRFLWHEEETKKENDEEASQRKITIWMPIHSIVFFVSGITVAEDLTLIPSFLFFGAAWILLTKMYYGSNHPNPWKRCKSVRDILTLAIFSENRRSINIKPYEWKQENECFEHLNSQKLEAYSGYFWGLVSSLLAYKRQYMTCDADDVSIETEDKCWNLFEDKLYYLHLPLYYMSMALRYFSRLFNWQHPKETFDLTFWVTVLGIVFLYIDWVGMIRWSLRIYFWTLGPWMKLFDTMVIRHHFTKLENFFKGIFETDFLREKKHKSEIAHEDALKLKQMRIYYFGKFSQEVPDQSTSPYQDIPRHESFASPAAKDQEIKIKTTYRGQLLQGSMILY